MNYLERYQNKVNLNEFKRLSLEKKAALNRPFWRDLRQKLYELPTRKDLLERGINIETHFNSSAVKIGKYEDLLSSEHELLDQIINMLMPWRKGPFELFGHKIDAEWRSDLKWDRLRNYLPNLNNKRVLDLGCGNGYYMFRILGKYRPELLLGLDPSEYFCFAFELFNGFLGRDEICYELLGVEHLFLFPEFFDVIFLMGVLYHQKVPIACLKSVRESLSVGGKLILETLAIPGEESIKLNSQSRYAKARNVYLVPCLSELKSILINSGFIEINICSMVKLEVSEQRKTKYMQFESLSDFLMPGDDTKTIEGYPAPWRVIITAIKGNLF